MAKGKRNKTKALAFQKAVQDTPDISTGYQPGLKALGNYSQKVLLNDTNACEGSVDIDVCTSKKYPNDNRWDYAFSYKGEVFYVEVHSAETGEVTTIIKKLQWLKDWLNTSAPEIKKLQAAVPFYWVQSGRFSILKTSPQFRRVIQEGIKPIPKLEL